MSLTSTVSARRNRIVTTAGAVLLFYASALVAQTTPAQRAQPPAKVQPAKPQEPQPQTQVAPAQPPAPVRFDIQRYVVEGNTLLSQGEVDKILAPFAGKNRDFGDIQRALETLQDAYVGRGYNAVRVSVPTMSDSALNTCLMPPGSFPFHFGPTNM